MSYISEREACTRRCWWMGAGIGVLAALILWLFCSWGFWASLFTGVVIAIIAGALLLWLLCSKIGQNASGSGGYSVGAGSASAASSTAASTSAAAGAAAAGAGAAMAARSSDVAASSDAGSDAGGSSSSAPAASSSSAETSSAAAAADTGSDQHSSFVGSVEPEPVPEPESVAPAAASPADEKPAAKKPAAKKSSGAKASAKSATTGTKNAAKKTTAKKPAEKKPAAKKTTTAAAKSNSTAKRKPVSADGKPETLTGPRSGGADDLKLIRGVGPQLEGTLHELGFYHFDQVASWRKKEVEWVDSRLKVKGRIERDDWIAQAKILAKGGETEFSRKKKKT